MGWLVYNHEAKNTVSCALKSRHPSHVSDDEDDDDDDPSQTEPWREKPSSAPAQTFHIPLITTKELTPPCLGGDSIHHNTK